MEYKYIKDMFGNIGIELVGMDITDRIESERQLIRNHKELTQLYEELSVSEVKLKRQYDELLYNKEQLERRKEYIRNWHIMIFNQASKPYLL